MRVKSCFELGTIITPKLFMRIFSKWSLDTYIWILAALATQTLFLLANNICRGNKNVFRICVIFAFKIIKSLMWYSNKVIRFLMKTAILPAFVFYHWNHRIIDGFKMNKTSISRFALFLKHKIIHNSVLCYKLTSSTGCSLGQQF